MYSADSGIAIEPVQLHPFALDSTRKWGGVRLKMIDRLSLSTVNPDLALFPRPRQVTRHTDVFSVSKNPITTRTAILQRCFWRSSISDNVRIFRLIGG